MNARRFMTLGCLCLATLASANAVAGKLSRAREQVRRPAPAAPAAVNDEPRSGGKLGRASQATRRVTREEEPRYGNRHRPRCSGWNGSFAWRHDPFACRPCTPPIVLAPSTVLVEQRPIAYANPDPVVYEVAPAVERRLGKQFASHPFANGADGFFTTRGDGKPWLGKVQFEFGDGSEEVTRTGLAILLEGESGLGIDFDWDSYAEQLPGGGHDELHLGQVNLTYRILESNDTLVRAGLGVGWLGDAVGTEAGLNLTVQADWLPSEDWIVSADLDFGVIGDAETQHVSGTIGRRFGPCELYGGYDYRRIGDVNLHGPMVGLRLWW
ncbi:hypothetical protein MalM25_04990 [Planctomycetes bacterium MalM25]|nr:hypothetical protein MalM25_04990 [Planctomycetes bacterium MalM25]